ncbi:MAG: hypothetical protein R6V56_00845 [Lentisphaeria bacterium]
MKDIKRLYNEMPKAHVMMLGLCGAMLAVFIATHLFLVRPVAQDVKALEQEVNSKRNNIRKRGWPVNVSKLQAIQNRKDRELTDIRKRKNRVIAKSTALFKDKIMRLYDTWQHFEEQVSRLDYQQEFLRIERKLSSRGIKLHKNVLQLSEDSEGRSNYELILQLWVLEAAADKIQAYDLQPVMVPAFKPDPDQPEADQPTSPPKASAITVLPAMPYYLNKTSRTPYLLEFGIRFKVKGKAADLYAFLRNVSASPDFLATPRMELRKPVPTGRENSEDTMATDIVCTAYYLLDKDARPAAEEKASKPKPLPAGA